MNLIWQTSTTGYFIDSRDKRKYSFVRIGNQIWIAKNFAYKVKGGNCWTYDDCRKNKSKYGYLYDWETAKVVAPEGWRLPTKSDFEILIQKVGGYENAYDALLEGGSSGFEAKLSGFRNYVDDYKDEGCIANFWTSTNKKKDLAWNFGLYCKYKSAGIYNALKNRGSTVRLLMDYKHAILTK